VSIIEAAKP